MEVLPDSSTIIALAKTDSLDLLKKTFNTICITKEVEGEITSGSFPDIEEIKRGIGKWIKVIESRTTRYEEFEGLGDGEKSILNYAKKRKNVLVILDETEARALAEEEGIQYTGTVGLVAFAFENRKIPRERAIEIIKKLAKSDFRMTVELYDWALEKLK